MFTLWVKHPFLFLLGTLHWTKAPNPKGLIIFQIPNRDALIVDAMRSTGYLSEAFEMFLKSRLF
jgi:hypothetical protein